MTHDLIDALDENGFPTGQTFSRKEIHQLGIHHRAVHIYLFNAKGELLLQQRTMNTDHYPGYFGISVTGHIDSGEGSGAAARRELLEELGLDLPLEFLFSFKQETTISPEYIDRQFNDVFICLADIPVTQIKCQPEEVQTVLYVPFSEFQNMIANPASKLAPVYASECKALIYYLRQSFKF